MSAKRTGHLYPRRNPWYSFSETESTSRHMVLLEETTEKPQVTPLGIDPGTVRLVARRLNHYATPSHSFHLLCCNFSIKYHILSALHRKVNAPEGHYLNKANVVGWLVGTFSNSVQPSTYFDTKRIQKVMHFTCGH